MYNRLQLPSGRLVFEWSNHVWLSNGGLKTGQKCLFCGLKCLVFKWSA